MNKAVLTLLVGLMLSLGGEVSASNILPNTNPEEQYNFALRKALGNDLETAEAAFAEFQYLNPGHPRVADSLFWLGRIQFLQQKFEAAAKTFSKFNLENPNDARVIETTLWIAEAVSRFAPAEQACAIYAELPNLLEAPSKRFINRLNALNKATNCDQFSVRDGTTLVGIKDITRIQQHVSNCWQPPLGAAGNNSLIIDILVSVNRFQSCLYFTTAKPKEGKLS